jgi:hypothetical protein
MRKFSVCCIIIAFFCACMFQSYAQSPIRTQAIIHTKINVEAPEDEDVSQISGNEDGGRRFNFRNMMDGETQSVVYIKGNLMKTTIQSETSKMALYRNDDEKSTTTIIEMMGTTQGFKLTDQEQADMQKMRDSMMLERRKKDTTRKFDPEREKERRNPKVLFEKSNDVKSIAGIKCNKGYLITLKMLGQRDTAIIWYAPEIRFNQLRFTGGLSGIPMMSMGNFGLTGTEQVEGFIMRYEMKMPRKRYMTVEVTKLELEKEVATKELAIPSNIEIKPFREMQQMFGGGRGGGWDGGGRQGRF